MSYSPHQFAVFRVLFGTYLAVHFAHLVPYAGELFSEEGMLPDPDVIPSVFPNAFRWFSTPAAAATFTGSLAMAAVLYAAGVHRRLCALYLWFGWASLLNRNPFISNPGIPYVGWLLLASLVIPEGEPFALKPRRPARDWRMPSELVSASWVLMGLGYTISGLHKATSPSWQDGSALAFVVSIPLARDAWLPQLVQNLPTVALQAMTWGALLLEVSALPLCAFRRTRPWIWVALGAMQIGILAMVAFADLTVGMLMIHLFVFDRRWLARSGRDSWAFRDHLLPGGRR